MGASSGIKLDGYAFQEALLGILTSYTADVAQAQKKAIRKTAKGALKQVKEHSDYENRTGEYYDNLGTKTAYEDPYNLRIHIVGKKKQYCLTHLLELGHIMPDGTRSKEYAHMQYGNEYVLNNLADNIRKEISKL